MSVGASRGFGPLHEMNQEALKLCLRVAGMRGSGGALWRAFGYASVSPKTPQFPGKGAYCLFKRPEVANRVTAM